LIVYLPFFSLGGGIAAVLAHLLKSELYPVRAFESEARQAAPVKCFAYSPPGCIISAHGKEYFETFCTSIVVGLDVIPRMYFFNFRNVTTESQAFKYTNQRYHQGMPLLKDNHSCWSCR
jgi:hypothetical protein